MPNETDVPFPDAQNVGKVYLHLAEIYRINVGEYSMHGLRIWDWGGDGVVLFLGGSLSVNG